MGFTKFVSASEQYSSVGAGSPAMAHARSSNNSNPSYEPPPGYVVDDYDPMNPTSEDAAPSVPLNAEGKPMSLKELFLAQQAKAAGTSLLFKHVFLFFGLTHA
jgi:hypothetical protein